MLLAPNSATRTRAIRPGVAAVRRHAVSLAFVLGAMVLLVATVWVNWGSAPAAVLTGLLVNAALAPLPHARPLHRRQEPADLS